MSFSHYKLYCGLCTREADQYKSFQSSSLSSAVEQSIMRDPHTTQRCPQKQKQQLPEAVAYITWLRLAISRQSPLCTQLSTQGAKALQVHSYQCLLRLRWWAGQSHQWWQGPSWVLVAPVGEFLDFDHTPQALTARAVICNPSLDFVYRTELSHT